MYFKSESNLRILSVEVSGCLGSMECRTVSGAFSLHGSFMLSASCCGESLLDTQSREVAPNNTQFAKACADP